MKLMLCSLACSVMAIPAIAESPSDSVTNVMFIHASPNTPPIDIDCSGEKLGRQELDYSQTTGYEQIEPGIHAVEIKSDENDSVIIPASLQFDPDSSYSVFVIDSASNAQLLVVPDNPGTPPAGQALIRFINLSPDSPALDFGITNGDVLLADREFTEHTPFEPIDAGTHNFELRIAGTDSVLMRVPETMVLADKAYTVLARGFLEGTGNQTLTVEMIENQ